MTDPMDAARIEMTPPGRNISQAEQDSWLKVLPGRWRFDPTAPISPLSARLLAASNALHSSVDYSCGGSFAPVGETKHYQREPK